MSIVISDAVLSCAPGVLYLVSAWATIMISSFESPGSMPTTLLVFAPGVHFTFACASTGRPSRTARSRVSTSWRPTLKSGASSLPGCMVTIARPNSLIPALASTRPDFGSTTSNGPPAFRRSTPLTPSPGVPGLWSATYVSMRRPPAIRSGSPANNHLRNANLSRETCGKDRCNSRWTMDAPASCALLPEGRGPVQSARNRRRRYSARPPGVATSSRLPGGHAPNARSNWRRSMLIRVTKAWRAW